MLELLAKVDLSALIATASRLRSNVPCTLPAVDASSEVSDLSVDLKLVMDQMGGQNCHLDIHFSDGVVWIARLRLNDPMLPPLETQRKIFDSEVGVLRFLEGTKVPAPKIFYHAFDQSEIGTPFVLMEKLCGSPLQWTEASSQQKSKVMEQLVDISLELEKYPFQELGSFDNSGTSIGPFAQGHMFSSPSHSLGPFDSPRTALESIIEHEIEMIENGELRTQAVDNYLTHLWRLERIPAFNQQATHRSFYIKHFDDKGDHILVDEQFNITGIIDWEFASTECKEVAFSSPCMLWPVGEYYEGSNRLSSEETQFAAMYQQRGREDLARIVLEGRKYQRFLFFLGATVSTHRNEFEALFQGLREAFDGPGIEPYADWREAAIAGALSRSHVLAQLVQAEQQKEKIESVV